MADGIGAKLSQLFKSSRGTKHTNRGERSERPPTVPSDVVRALVVSSTAQARELLSYDHATRYQALPLAVVSSPAGQVVSLVVAGSAELAERKRTLQFAIGREVRLIPAPSDIVIEAIYTAYHRDAQRLVEIVRRLKSSPAAASARHDPPVDSLPVASEDPAVFLDRLIDYAIAHRASDIHIIPRREGSLVRIRVNGVLLRSDEGVCPDGVHRQLVGRVKALARIATTALNTPLDGGFHLRRAQRTIGVRVSIMPTFHGDKVVLRLIGSEVPLSVEGLRLPSRAELHLRAALQRNEGMILVCGPTGSGKTTTLYAAAAEAVTAGNAVVSVENPIEVEVPGVCQTDVDEVKGLSYESALRAVLRQDPDVIMVGEIRDAVSARTAMQAAITGHLVVSSVHARRVSDVLLRLSHFGIDPLTISEALTLVMSQRLIPTLCPSCKVVDLEQGRDLPCQVYRAVGCAACDYGGYMGSRIATEALMITGPVRAELRRGHCPELRQGVEGYLAFHETSLDLLHEGLISYSAYQQLLEDTETDATTAAECVRVAS